MIGVMCLMFCLHFEKIFCLSSNRFQVAVASMQDAKDVVELTVLREPNEPIPLSSYVVSSAFHEFLHRCAIDCLVL